LEYINAKSGIFSVFKYVNLKYLTKITAHFFYFKSTKIFHPIDDFQKKLCQSLKNSSSERAQKEIRLPYYPSSRSLPYSLPEELDHRRLLGQELYRFHPPAGLPKQKDSETQGIRWDCQKKVVFIRKSMGTLKIRIGTKFMNCSGHITPGMLKSMFCNTE